MPSEVKVGEPVEEILRRLRGQDVWVVVEVLKYNKKSYEPITGRLVGAVSEREEASKLSRGLKFAIVQWMGKLAENIILHADPAL